MLMNSKYIFFSLISFISGASGKLGSN
jgi:hypothetical protein